MHSNTLKDQHHKRTYVLLRNKKLYLQATKHTKHFFFPHIILTFPNINMRLYVTLDTAIYNVQGLGKYWSYGGPYTVFQN